VDNKVSSDYVKSQGVAVYIPASGFDTDYNQLLFSGTKWLDFIKFMEK
jgi:hypothetical protein